jgi:DnaJ family protein B protein 11
MSSVRTRIGVVVVLVLLSLVVLVFSKGADYYATLSVPRNADAEQIKRAYKKLTLKHHPDRNRDDPEASKKFAAIQHAYDVLSDPKKKAVYDKYGEEGLKQQQQGGGGHPMDVFSDIFGGGFGFNFGGGFGDAEEVEEEFKGDDLKIPLDVSLEDLYSGKLLHFTRIRSAHHDNAQPKPCECRNKVIRMMIVNGQMQRVTENNCQECRDRFEVIQKTTDLTVEIDKGMREGETLTFYGEGDATTATRAGDLIFVVRLAPHKQFVRQGDDLKMKMLISLKDALVGFSTKIKHLDGREIVFESKEVLKPGDVRKIAGEGMPHRGDTSRHGDLHIEFDVKFPTSLTDKQKEDLKKIL